MEPTITIDPYTSSYRFRKKVTFAGMIAIIITCLLWLSMPFASATKDLEDPDDQTEWSKMHKDWQDLKEDVEDEMADGMFDSIDAVFTGKVDKDANIINRSLSGVKKTLENSKLFNNIASALEGLALFITWMYAFIVLFNELQRGDGSIEMWAKCFVTLAIGVVVVTNWSGIIHALDLMGEYCVDLIKSQIDKSDSSKLIKKWFDSMFEWGDQDIDESASGIFKIAEKAEDVFSIYAPKWFQMGEMIILCALFEIPLISARIILLTIVIEIYIRKAFFPLALADIAGQGMRSPGVQYMKKFVALYLRIGMCYIIAAVGNVIVNAALNITTKGFFEGMMKMICICIAYLTCTNLYKSTSGISSQIMGM